MLVGEVDLDMDGFEVVLEPEFTLVLVKVKDLGGGGRGAERADRLKCKAAALALQFYLC